MRWRAERKELVARSYSPGFSSCNCHIAGGCNRTVVTSASRTKGKAFRNTDRATLWVAATPIVPLEVVLYQAFPMRLPSLWQPAKYTTVTRLITCRCLQTQRETVEDVEAGVNHLDSSLLTLRTTESRLIVRSSCPRWHCTYARGHPQATSSRCLTGPPHVQLANCRDRTTARGYRAGRSGLQMCGTGKQSDMQALQNAVGTL